MRFLNIAFTVFLLNISGCAILSSNADEIAANASKASSGTIEVNASENGGASEGVATCDTKYSESSKGRAHNIKLAAKTLNGKTIAPGEVFSFNETIGPAQKKDGYKKARIFVRGQDAEGYGGGICQLSSALYNCALDLGLNIVERHPHSKPVGYVPENRDATTNYGTLDFKFENTLDKTLKITATANNGVLNVKLQVA